MGKYLTEFIGTFFLVFTVACTVTKNEPLAALAIGSVLMVMVYMGGHISGGHYNPAVSLAVLIRGKVSVIDFILYIVVQMLGAICAAAAGKFITGHALTPSPGENFMFAHALVAEILFSFALALVVLQVATNDKVKGNSFYGLAIGFTVFAGAAAVGSISGAAFNPAVGVGPNLLFGQMQNIPLYLIGPFAGGALAGIVYRLQDCCS